jgi:hypothetical protein
MMTMEVLAPAFGGSHTAAASIIRCKPPAFSTRPGRAKRVLRLAREAGMATAVRGGLSLIYARLRADSRVRDMRHWSDAAVESWANRVGATPPGAAGLATDFRTPVGSDDMRQLLGRLTRGCSKTVQPDVFHMIVKRYCRRADTARLAGLRGVIGNGSWAGQLPADDPARMAWETLSSMVDGELARRALIAPLKQVADALARDASPEALDGACVRLAVALSRNTGGQAGHGILVSALKQLSHAELRTMAVHLSPPGAIGDAGAAGGSMTGACRMAVAMRHVHRSADLRQRRMDLIAQLQSAVGDAVGEQLHYFVRATSQLIDFQGSLGRSPQAVQTLAAASLKKSLDSLRYPAFPGMPTGDDLVARIFLHALASKPAPAIGDFLRGLKFQTLAQLLRAAEDTPEFSDLADAMRQERENRLLPHRDLVRKHLRDLKDAQARRDRWAVAQGLKALALTLRIWDCKREQYGGSMPQDLELEVHAAVKRALSPLFRGPDNPGGPLNYASLSVLCDREIECLRGSETRLREYGLGLDESALARLAGERSRPYMDMGVEHAVAMMEMLAETPPTPDRIIPALCDCVDVLHAACGKQASFVQMGVEDTARVALEIMQEAWTVFADRRPEQVAPARAGIGHYARLLANGFLDAATCLVDELEGESMDDDDRRQHPASHAARMMRLASQFMEAVGSVSVPEGEEAPRDARGGDLASRWSPALRKAVAEQFGVHYDARLMQAALVMTLAQHQEFARQLLKDEMTVKASSTREISSPDGTTVVELDRQLILDGIERPSAQFSVSGIGSDGRYIPYTSSAPIPSDVSHVAGVDRALVALQQLAGPDTVELSSYMSQSIGADFLQGLVALGPESPVRLADGRAVLLCGDGSTRTDLTRQAGGTYLLRLSLVWDRLKTVMAFDGADVQGINLDADRSFASMSCEVRLARNPRGGWHRQVTSPLSVRYHLVPFAAQEAA